MAEDIDIELGESGLSEKPTYDISTNEMVDTKGQRRDPDWHETVAASVKKQQIDRNPDPWERARARVQRNGGDHEDVVRRLEAISDIHDPYDQIDWLKSQNGITDQQYWDRKHAQYQGLSQAQAQERQFTEQTRHARDLFDRAHPGIGYDHPIRKEAVKIIEREDKRLFGKKENWDNVPTLEIFERAFSLAKEDTNPTERIKREMARRADKAII